VFSVLVCRKDFTQKLTLLFFHEAIPDSTSWAEIWVSTANRGCAHGPELTSLRSALTPKGCGTEDRPKRLLKTELFQDLATCPSHVKTFYRSSKQVACGHAPGACVTIPANHCLLVFGLSLPGPAKAPTYLFLLSQLAPRMIGNCEAAVCGYLYISPQSHAGRH
jgi:hypothetical protein